MLPSALPACQLVAASRFSIDQLVAAYNETRVDYLVPMPMNAARLAEYIRFYDVNLDVSVVAVDETEQILGLGMLGLRDERAWITRLGVLPERRRRGIGRAIMDHLLAAGEKLGARRTVLEVIEHNDPAYALFLECRFYATRTLLVLRRPPGPAAFLPAGEVHWVERDEALALLPRRADRPSWLMETQSFTRMERLRALTLRLLDGGQGWLVFQQQNFRNYPFLLSHLVMHTETGDPEQVGLALLAHLYYAYHFLDTHTENVLVDDPHLPAFKALGYVESFRRTEMYRERPAA